MSMGEWVAMITWQIPDWSMRRSSLRNSICRDGDKADSSSSKDEDALPSAALREEPQKAFAVRIREEIRCCVPGFDRRPVEVARDREEAFGPKKPTVGDFGQPARA